MSKDAQRFRPLFLIAITTLSLQCARQHTADQGGQDTGGGFVKSSSPESVNSALDLAIQLATESDLKNNIFVQFWKSEAAKLNSVSAIRFFPKVQDGSDLKTKFESPVFEAFKQNKIVRLQKGDCPQSIIGKHADASVSSLNLSATICFSIGNLTRLTPAVVLRETLSLLLHEASHIGGAEEAEAVAWQESFSAYFGKRFGEVPSPNLTGDTFKQLSVIRIHLARAQKLANDNPDNNRILGLLGTIAEELETLPYYSDGMAIRLKINPTHPEMIEAYSKSVMALVQKLQAKVNQYGVGYSTMAVRPESDEPVPSKDVLPLLIEVAHDLDTVTENFLAIIGPSID